MKHIFFIIISLTYTINIKAQNLILSVASGKIGSALILCNTNTNETIDTIGQYSYAIELLDYKIYSTSEIAHIVKSRIGYQYFKVKKIDGLWHSQPQCGFVAGNPNSLSFVKPGIKYPDDNSFKILDDDVVTFKYATVWNPNKEGKHVPIDEVITVDCKKNEAQYYQRIRKYEEWQKKNVDNKKIKNNEK